MNPFVIEHRRALIVAFHASLVAGSSYFAYLVLSDGMMPLRYMEMYWHLLPWLIVIRLFTFAPFHLYQGMWRYTGMADFAAIVSATSMSTILVFLIAGCVLGIACPTPVYIVDTLVLILSMGGLRAVRVVYYGIGEAGRRKRVVVYGAGDVGAMVIREMKNSRRSEYQPVGLIDDNVAMKGRWIHGVKVLGGGAELERLVAEEEAQILLLALPGITPARVREIVKRLERFQIGLKTLPPFNDLVDSNVQLDRIRSVALGDLLVRKPLELDSRPLEHLIGGKRVLVTGAGDPSGRN
jgi:FlaA1/EpsC-like NDP-sugar epimerase